MGKSADRKLVEAVIVAELPQRLFRVRSGDQSWTASLSGHLRRVGTQLRTGQRVLVREATLDPGRAIILERRC